MGGSELLGKEEIAEVIDVIERGVLFRYGFDEKRKNIFKVAEFEESFTRYIGIDHALGVASGTAALRVALASLGIEPGDEVITQSFTFVATVEAIMEAGATPVIVEIDRSLNMDPSDFEAKITRNTKAIIPVHMLGVPARMDEICDIAKKNSIKILEDSCQACGSSYKGKKTGTIGDMGCFSFDFVKTITTGEGGMVITDDKELYLRSTYFHDHGHEHNPNLPRGKDDKSIVGFNYRMSEIQGAIGVVQLSRLDHVISNQRKNKTRIKEAIKDIDGLEFRDLPDKDGDGGDTLVFFLPKSQMAKKTEDILTKEGIETKILPSALGWHYTGSWKHIISRLNRQKGENIYSRDSWPQSENMLNRAIAIGISVNMTDDDLDKIIAGIRKAVNLSLSL
ncbi:MAG: DegT/DnrJ/EryC1/StrS family aminotransferase [Thermodesulfobacteriota bacterium]|nr:DegT/DnrJ/EryC1/StrS family aminotransferase [Thermodesulfobacteriota bacterium]